MVKNFLQVLSFAVVCLAATNASAGWYWGSFFNWNSYDSKYDFHYDSDRSCNPIPEPSGALLFAAGGVVFAAAKRRNRRS